MTPENSKYILSEKVLMATGVFMIIFSFISEFHFHFIQGFMPDTVPSEIFWRAEAAEVLNSMTFLILGIILVIVTIIIAKKRRKTES